MSRRQRRVRAEVMRAVVRWVRRIVVGMFEEGLVVELGDWRIVVTSEETIVGSRDRRSEGGGMFVGRGGCGGMED
jgi:hypothetical protein